MTWQDTNRRVRVCGLIFLVFLGFCIVQWRLSLPQAAIGGFFLPGKASTLVSSVCDSPLVKHFDPSEIQLAAQKNWDHVLNLHTKLATLLDSDAFQLNNSHVPFDLLPPIGPPCQSGLETIGSPAWGDDNDKRVCGLSSLQEEGCIVYSVGGHGEWGFEEGVVRDTVCRVHTFDCTGDYAVPDHLRHRVSFHKACLASAASETADGLRYVPWDQLVALAGHAGAPTHVKMDIEGWEYSALTAILDGSAELMPLQISLELHWYTGGVGGPYWGNAPLPLLMRNGHHLDVGRGFVPPYMGPGEASPRYAYKTPGEIAAFGSLLFLKGGYGVVSRADNPHCKHCTELVLARLFCPPHGYEELSTS